MIPWSVHAVTFFIIMGGAALAFLGMYLLISYKLRFGYHPNRRSTDK